MHLAKKEIWPPAIARAELPMAIGPEPVRLTIHGWNWQGHHTRPTGVLKCADCSKAGNHQIVD